MDDSLIAFFVAGLNEPLKSLLSPPPLPVLYGSLPLLLSSLGPTSVDSSSAGPVCFPGSTSSID